MNKGFISIKKHSCSVLTIPVNVLIAPNVDQDQDRSGSKLFDTLVVFLKEFFEEDFSVPNYFNNT